MSSVLTGTLLLTATGLFSQVVGFGYRIALSRLIGAETMGLYQLVMPVYSVLLSLTAVGLTVAVATLSAGGMPWRIWGACGSPCAGRWLFFPAGPAPGGATLR